jgi:hypothetical protein
VFVVTDTCALAEESWKKLPSPTAFTVTLYEVLSAIDAYVDDVMVVDAPVTPVLVPSCVAPAALNSVTVYEVASDTAPHDTSIDFNVDEVAVATTEVGVPRGVGVGAVTNTAALPVDSFPSPN